MVVKVLWNLFKVIAEEMTHYSKRSKQPIQQNQEYLEWMVKHVIKIGQAVVNCVFDGSGDRLGVVGFGCAS